MFRNPSDLPNTEEWRVKDDILAVGHFIFRSPLDVDQPQIAFLTLPLIIFVLIVISFGLQPCSAPYPL